MKPPAQTETDFLCSAVILYLLFFVSPPTDIGASYPTAVFVEHRLPAAAATHARLLFAFPGRKLRRKLGLSTHARTQGGAVCVVTTPDSDNHIMMHLQFPQSDVHSTLARLKDVIEAKRQTLNYDQLEQRSVPFDDFYHLMRHLTRDACFTDHDIITVARYYQDRKGTDLPLDVLLAIVQEQLKRASWEEFEYIEDQCLHHDNIRLNSYATPQMSR
jgi:hypothetical protein